MKRAALLTSFISFTREDSTSTPPSKSRDQVCAPDPIDRQRKVTEEMISTDPNPA